MSHPDLETFRVNQWWLVNPPQQQAWECPVCHKGNGPAALKCGHCADKIDLTPRSE